MSIRGDRMMAMTAERAAEELPAGMRVEDQMATRPLVEVLGQLAGVVQSVTDEQYSARPVPVIGSSIGGHVRHCLDHVAALLAGLEGGGVNYDVRERGTRVESCRGEALKRIRRVQSELLRRGSIPADLPVILTTVLAVDGPACELETTAGRELSFVLSHTIHHNALVGVIVRWLGGEPPGDFGCAPATLRHRAGQSCAP
jgi:hypothetical protein